MTPPKKFHLVFPGHGDSLPEIPRATCHELTARAYRRTVGDEQLCIPCSAYDR